MLFGGTRVFTDRREAGRALASALEQYRASDAIVLGLARGGVPVAYEVASALGFPLDVLIVRKLGVPGHEELAMGAIASGGASVLNMTVLTAAGISEETLKEVVGREREELQRREKTLRGDAPPLDVAGRVAMIVDDGLATGATMRAAAQALRGPAKRVVAAVPVAAPESLVRLRQEADEVVCLAAPQEFSAVGEFYLDFKETSEEEVRALLAAAHS